MAGLTPEDGPAAAGFAESFAESFVARFNESMRSFQLPPQPVIAVAVSGGGDSMALACLLKNWVDENGGTVTALMVDHALRDGSRAELENAAAFLEKRGVPCHILTWRHDGIESRIQEKARAARYELLDAACRDRHAGFLAVGHNLEDQAETFWMRLSHGSGLDGLSGMPPVRRNGDIAMIRPVLGFTRGELRDYCRQNAIPFADDPSNSKAQFLRVRLRGFEDVLAAEGLTAQRLGHVMRKLEDARSALDWVSTRAVDDCSLRDGNGILLKRAAWRAYPQEIRRRVLIRLLQSLCPQPYPPGADALDRLCAQIDAETFAGGTLAGVQLKRVGGDIHLQKENRN